MLRTRDVRGFLCYLSECGGGEMGKQADPAGVGGPDLIAHFRLGVFDPEALACAPNDVHVSHVAQASLTHLACWPLQQCRAGSHPGRGPCFGGGSGLAACRTALPGRRRRAPRPPSHRSRRCSYCGQPFWGPGHCPGLSPPRLHRNASPPLPCTSTTAHAPHHQRPAPPKLASLSPSLLPSCRYPGVAAAPAGVRGRPPPETASGACRRGGRGLQPRERGAHLAIQPGHVPNRRPPPCAPAARVPRRAGGASRATSNGFGREGGGGNGGPGGIGQARRSPAAASPPRPLQDVRGGSCGGVRVLVGNGWGPAAP